MPEPVATEVYTVEEVAKILRIGRNAAYAAVKSGEIPSRKLGSRILVPKFALDRWLAAAYR